MVRTPGWLAVSASAYLGALALLVLYLDGVALNVLLAGAVVAGSVGLVVLLSRLHPHPAIALADRRLDFVLGVVPVAGLCVVGFLPDVTAIPIEPPLDAGTGLLLCWAVAGIALYASAANAQARYYQKRSARVVHLRVRPTFRTRRRRTAIAGVLGVALVAVGLGVVVRVPSPSSSLVMGLGFSALFSGILGARRPRTYCLLDDGLIRQDNGALVRTFVPHSRIEVAGRTDERLRLERRGPWYPATEFTVDDIDGDRNAAARWFAGATAGDLHLDRGRYEGAD